MSDAEWCEAFAQIRAELGLTAPPWWGGGVEHDPPAD